MTPEPMDQPSQCQPVPDIGFACPDCGGRRFRVLQTRRTWGERIRRQRQCRSCGRQVITYERLA